MVGRWPWSWTHSWRRFVYWSVCFVVGHVLWGCAFATYYEPAPDAGVLTDASFPEGYQVDRVPTRWRNPSLLTEASELQGLAGKAGLHILDVRSAAQYTLGHHPKAVHFPQQQFMAKRGTLTNMATDRTTLELRLRRAGLTKRSRVVLIDHDELLWASRLFWTLEHYGLSNVSILHGGHQAWIAAKGAVSRKTFTPPLGDVSLQAQPHSLTDYATLLARIERRDPTLVLIDARTLGEYQGTSKRAKYAGRIPGAVHIEWKFHLRWGQSPKKLKAPEELWALFHSRRVTPKRDVVAYCQSAIRASHSYLVLRLLGYPRLKLYDGSWVEWGNRDDSPKE